MSTTLETFRAGSHSECTGIQNTLLRYQTFQANFQSHVITILTHRSDLTSRIQSIATHAARNSTSPTMQAPSVSVLSIIASTSIDPARKHTIRQVSRANSYYNWPTAVGGLLVMQFDRPSQSWLSSLTSNIPGMGNPENKKPIKLKFKICAFEHNI